ncbi:MAG: 16S rRNA pseudouridine(516) synthase, partial [Clostridia bacterium]|nr:16S rRNA pseudouridine(516) synthase [Clostridia bacterium]
MRIDRFLSNMGVCTRTEAARAARAGNITVNGKAVRDVSAHIDPEKDEVVFAGRRVGYEKYT